MPSRIGGQVKRPWCHAASVPGQQLHSVHALAAEHEDVAAMRICVATHIRSMYRRRLCGGTVPATHNFAVIESFAAT
jgi:hypothetical protein